MANTFPTVEQIAEKHQRGETLTAWESSVYRLNFRDDGTRYSTDPKMREAQYAEDNARTQRRVDIKRPVSLEQRLTVAVAKKLDTAVTFVRWIPKSTGDVPVFRVPLELIPTAKALGLTVEA